MNGVEVPETLAKMPAKRRHPLDSSIARRLRGAPRLLASYFAYRNSSRRNPTGRLRLLGGLGALWLIGAGVLWTQRESIERAIAAMDANHWLIAGVLIIAASVLVSRRRAALENNRAHDWLTALPVTRATARGENYFYQLLPMVWLLATLWIALCTAAVIEAIAGSQIWSLLWLTRDVTVGALLGAGLGSVIPLSKQEVLPPGSRYVPHRKTRTRALVPSTKALGIWPIRQMFASARPKTVSRAALFILLGLPLGSSADVAMVVIGLCALLALLSLLTAGVATVTKAASTWLAPLPITPSVLARSLLLPSVAFALAGALLEIWLLWLLRMAVPRAAAYALLTLFAVLIIGGIGFLTSRRPA